MSSHLLMRFTLLSLLLFTLLSGTSCKRKADPEPLTVVGDWKGQFSNNTTIDPNLPWDLMTLKTGGVLEGSNRAGTYNVSGSILTATYVRSGSTFSFRCEIKENFTKLEGTWGNGASQTNGGKILLTKQ